MTNHHGELRVAPDPARAEDLRRHLHARLASGSRDEPVVPTQDDLVSMPSVDADPDEREGDLIMLETEDRRTGDQAAAPRRRSPNTWLMVAAAAVVVAVVGTLLVAAGDDDDDKQIDTVTPTPTATFVSPRNGFAVKYFDRGDGTVTPAKQLWGFGIGEQLDDGFDVVETGLAAVFKGASTELMERPPGFSNDELDEYFSARVEDVLPGGCGVPRSQQVEITIDGQSGRISECANRIEATVVAGGRLYLFTLLHDRSDARAVFDAFVATIDLRPETAVDFPALTTTFVSPTYGFSFRHWIRLGGGFAPATELWDPVVQPPFVDDSDNLHADPFDVVETGLGGFFGAASTEIPGGVSIDAWVDEHVSPGYCGAPRSQQAEITIDGQSGRISECAQRIEATVVAGGRLYLFTVFHSRSDARAWFDAWVATIDLTPETAAVP